MSDIKTLKLTLKKKPIEQEAGQTGLEVSQRIGKKVVYQIKKPEASASVVKPAAPVAKKPTAKPKAPSPTPKKEKKAKEATPTAAEIMAYRKEKAERAIAWLIERYPKLFTPEAKKALALGTHKHIRLENLKIPRGFIATGLTAWVQTIDYCQAVISGVGRYDLEGNLVGEITDEQRAHAVNYLKRLEKR